MEQLLRTYNLGDMQAVYILNGDSQTPELLLLPEGMEWHTRNREKPYTDSLLQIKLAQDASRDGYTGGISMRNSASVDAFKYDDQEQIDDIDPLTGLKRTMIKTYLKDSRGYEAVHVLSYIEGDKSARSYVNFRNTGKKKVTVEMLSSFSLGKISPFMAGDGHDTIKVHRIRSVWSMEGRLESRTLEDLQLEPSWGGHAVRCERFGAVGSLAVNKFMPVMAIEDTRTNIYWGASIAHNGSWQMEIYRRGDDLEISGGLADREFGHWFKIVKPGEEFTTPEAILSVCRTTQPDVIFQRLSYDQDKYVNLGPESEQSLPVMFNEYCSSWGEPTAEDVEKEIESVIGHDIDYFVIDAGWYRSETVNWTDSMGDYDVADIYFPDGLAPLVEKINENGMRAGLWFEIDNVAKGSEAFKKENMLLKRDGLTITTMGRRFRDMRKKEVIDFLTEKVIGTLKDNGFSYIKIDCNDTVGIGCDGAESLGEGLRQNQIASADFIRKIRNDIPDIVIENCASGGHKLEPLMMSLCDMASFSDAHECREIPIIAANLHRVILPRQSQIWAVLRNSDSDKRIVYSLAATFLGRMCLSGDMASLSQPQWKLVDEGIMFYKMVSPIIKRGSSQLIESETNAYRHPKGWQAVVREQIIDEDELCGDDLLIRRKTQKGLMVVIHTFDGSAGTRINVPIPIEYTLKSVYSHMVINLLGRCEFIIPEDNMAIALYYVN